MYIAYIYNGSNNIIAQLDELQEVEAIHKLNAVGTGVFTIRDDQFKTLLNIGSLSDTAYKMINIVRQDTNGDELGVITGYIVWYDGDFDFKRVAIKTLLHILERREIQINITIPGGTSYSSAINTIMTHINTVHNTNIVVKCNTTDTIVDPKNYTTWQSVLAIIKDLAGSKYDYDVRTSRPLENNYLDPFTIDLLFWSVGVDRSNDVLFQDDIANPDAKNISVKGTIDFTKFANAVKAKSSSSVSIQVDLADIASRGIRLDATISPQGNLTTEASNELQKRLQTDTVLDIVPDEIGDDFYIYNVGDIVEVYVYHNDQLLDYSGTMKITEKKLDAGEVEKNTLKIGFYSDDEDDTIATEKKTKERVKKLELYAL